MDTLMSAEEVRTLLRVSRRTFESIVARNEAPPYLFVGRQRRWKTKDVQNWIDARTMVGAGRDRTEVR